MEQRRHDEAHSYFHPFVIILSDKFEIVSIIFIEFLNLFFHCCYHQRFAELQSQALQALLCAYPSLAAPVIAWALDAESVALGSRLSCIVALEMAAETISGIHSKQGRAAAAVTEGTASVGMNAVSSIAVSDISSPATRSPSLLGDDPAASSQTPGGREQNLAGKTRIKRPKMLAAWRRREEARNSSSSEQTRRNNFGAVAHLFFYPVLQALATALRGTVGTSSKGLSSTSPSLRIGSDTFLTSRGESGTTTQVGGRYIPSILLLPVDGQESGVGGGLTGSDTAHTRTKAGRPKEDQGDSLQSLLPARALLALGTFTRCCINAPVQRYRSILLLVGTGIMNSLCVGVCIYSFIKLNFKISNSTPPHTHTPFPASKISLQDIIDGDHESSHIMSR